MTDTIRYDGGEPQPEIIGGEPHWPNAKLPPDSSFEIENVEARMRSLYPNYQTIDYSDAAIAARAKRLERPKGEEKL